MSGAPARARPLVLACLTILSVGCAEDPVTVPFRILTGDLGDRAAAFQVQLFGPGVRSCPSLESLQEGRNFAEEIDFQLFRTDEMPSEIGPFTRGRYCVTALLRDRFCFPIGYGHRAIELGGGPIEITVEPPRTARVQTYCVDDCIDGVCTPHRPSPPPAMTGDASMDGSIDGSVDGGADGGVDGGVDGGSGSNCDSCLDGEVCFEETATCAPGFTVQIVGSLSSGHRLGIAWFDVGAGRIEDASPEIAYDRPLGSGSVAIRTGDIIIPDSLDLGTPVICRRSAPDQPCSEDGPMVLVGYIFVSRDDGDGLLFSQGELPGGMAVRAVAPFVLIYANQLLNTEALAGLRPTSRLLRLLAGARFPEGFSFAGLNDSGFIAPPFDESVELDLTLPVVTYPLFSSP